MIGQVSSAQFDQESESMERDLSTVFTAIEEEIQGVIDEAERNGDDATDLLLRLDDVFDFVEEEEI